LAYFNVLTGYPSGMIEEKDNRHRIISIPAETAVLAKRWRHKAILGQELSCW
jgi:hypothetical protein